MDEGESFWGTDPRTRAPRLCASGRRGGGGANQSELCEDVGGILGGLTATSQELLHWQPLKGTSLQRGVGRRDDANWCVKNALREVGNFGGGVQKGDNIYMPYGSPHRTDRVEIHLLG